MKTVQRRPVIGYTLGDQAGIGPEMIDRALRELSDVPADFVCLGKRIACTPGQPTPETAKEAWEHLKNAAAAMQSGEVDAVVTAPVCKQSLQKLGFSFPGQTEFFADRLGVKHFAMCLSGVRLTVVLCTTHIALRDVPRVLNSEQIVHVGELLVGYLKTSGQGRPRIAIAGLNPHGGEAGAFGDEEERIIAPAVEELRRKNPEAEIDGPCVPDCVYRDAAQGIYHGVVAPYHDQALIPLKLLDFDNAVNMTLGLPRLRVSPDHGTAFSLAGSGRANPASTLRAFRVALKHCSRRVPD